MIRSLHPPLCQCGNVLSTGHSALQCPTLLEVTQKLAPCPPSQLPQSQLSAQPMKLGEAALLWDANPKLSSSSSCSLTCWTSWAAEHFPGNSFSSPGSLLPTFGQGSVKAANGDRAEPVAPNTCQGWGRTDQLQEQGTGSGGSGILSWRCVCVSAGWAQLHIQPLKMRVWRNGREIWTEHPNDITSTVESRA